jgi:hypothetical protein
MTTSRVSCRCGHADCSMVCSADRATTMIDEG